MAMATSIIPGITTQVTSGVTSAPSSTAASATAGIDKQTVMGNFQTFLSLLTTQLKNQNPLDPLDTNQFTQQLVQFAQVEQQMKSNDQLATLVSFEKNAQSTYALAFVGSTVAVDGATTNLKNGVAQWSFSVSRPCTATVNITSATGQVVYTGSFTMQPGAQNFMWDGRDNNGVKWPDGTYTMSVTAKDTSGQTTAVSTEIIGTVTSVDLTQNPPLLSIGGSNFTLDKVKRVVLPASIDTGSGG
jgi:flagellar basal-body rod modification protein FlgD